MSHKTTLLSISFVLFVFSAADAARAKPKWIGTWATAPQLVEPANLPPAPGLTNNTLRQIVCVSVGGRRLRIRFSNDFSKEPVTMRTVQIAVSKGNGAIDESTVKDLKFGGSAEFTMAAGTEVISDPVDFNLAPRMEVAITIFFGATSQTVTGHPGSRTTSYILPGDHTGKGADFSAAAKTDHWYVINAIDVEKSDGNAAAVAILGDSITDGRGSGTNKQDRWPDIFAMALQEDRRTRNVGVLNLGIGGNAVLRGGLGPFALSRYDRDILKQSGVKWVIIYEGVNDLGGKRDSTQAANIADGLIDAYGKMIDQAHARGLEVYGATITPIKKSFYFTPYAEMARSKVNGWIRNSGRFDAVIDFDKAIQDPNDPLTMSADSQFNDYLHPNELGHRKLGAAIPASLFH